jgi:hypothetical protein
LIGRSLQTPQLQPLYLFNRRFFAPDDSLDIVSVKPIVVVSDTNHDLSGLRHSSVSSSSNNDINCHRTVIVPEYLLDHADDGRRQGLDGLDDWIDIGGDGQRNRCLVRIGLKASSSAA